MSKVHLRRAQQREREEGEGGQTAFKFQGEGSPHWTELSVGGRDPPDFVAAASKDGRGYGPCSSAQGPNCALAPNPNRTANARNTLHPPNNPTPELWPGRLLWPLASLPGSGGLQVRSHGPLIGGDLSHGFSAGQGTRRLGYQWLGLPAAAMEPSNLKAQLQVQGWKPDKDGRAQGGGGARLLCWRASASGWGETEDLSKRG